MMIASEPRFYETGGTLSPNAPSYVSRQADRDLYDALSRGEFCYVLTSRQMGKSSLTARTLLRLREAGVAAVGLDLTAVGQNVSVEQWYDGLLGFLGQQLNLEDELEDFWLSHERLGPLQRWMLALREVVLVRCPGAVVVFINEIDAVRSLPFSTDEFFAAIRECYNRRGRDPEYGRLTFCLLGVASPSDLIQDVRTTPFNIGRRIELTDFTAAEAAPLAAGLGREGQSGQAVSERVLYWTGGHPYLTQRLCRAVAEDATVTSAAGVDRLCAAFFLTHGAEEKESNLEFVRDRLLRSPVDRAGLLDLYGKVRAGKQVAADETNELVGVLRLAGIVRVADGRLWVRNRIYTRVFDRTWVTMHMPDAERRRQRAAYRQGLLRTAVVASVILAFMGGLSYRAFRAEQHAEAAAKQARDEAVRANRNLYFAKMALAQQAWEANNFEQLGQVLTETRNSPERGFEWGYWLRLRHLGILTLRGHSGAINSVAFSPDGRRLLTGSGDRTARLWDSLTGRECLTLRGHSLTLRGHSRGISSVVFSRDGWRLLTGSGDGTAKLWDAVTGHELLTLRGHGGQINSVAFRPDGRRLLTGSDDHTARLWDAATGHELRTLTLNSQNGLILSVAFSPDGRRLFTGSWDGTAKLWDAATGHELLTFRGHKGPIMSVACSRDGKRLLTGSLDKTAKVWDTATGRELLTLRGHRESIFSVAFSPDGRRLLTGSEDHTAKLWDAAFGQPLLTLKGHNGRISSVAFSRDGKRLLTGSEDTTARLWTAASDPQIAAWAAGEDWH